jgi:predicted HicB family RNase H-like nuclease
MGVTVAKRKKSARYMLRADAAWMEAAKVAAEAEDEPLAQFIRKAVMERIERLKEARAAKEARQGKPEG